MLQTRRLRLVVVGWLVVLAAGCAAPTMTGTPAPTIGPTTIASLPATRLKIAITVENDAGMEPMRVTVEDLSGVLKRVQPAPVDAVTRNLGALGESSVAVTAGDEPTQALVLWSGFGCGTTGSILIDERGDTIVIAPGPIRDCDLAPVHRGVVMTFHHEVAVETFSLVLVPTPVIEDAVGGGSG